MTAFYVCGLVLAGWALLVAFLGITRKGFPGSVAAERAVATISVVLAVAAVASGVLGAALMEHEEDHERGGERAALAPRA